MAQQNAQLQDAIAHIHNPLTRLFQWAPVSSMFLCLGLGILVRMRYNMPSFLSSVRTATFDIFLPIYIFRSMWIVKVNMDLAKVAVYSLATHAVAALVWHHIFKKVHDRQKRAWLNMSTQGCILSFLYSSAEAKFGPNATAVCLLWDLFGNFIVCQGYLFGIASVFAAKDTLSSPQPFAQQAKVLTKSILVQPILLAFLAGLALNLAAVPCSTVINVSLELTGSLFRPLMYLVLGLLCSFDILRDRAAVSTVMKALALRYALGCVLALLIYNLAPLEYTVRATISLALLAPASSIPIYLAAEYKYAPRYAAMSALLTSISVLVSFAAQQTLLAWF
jgi:predicted permease